MWVELVGGGGFAIVVNVTADGSVSYVLGAQSAPGAWSTGTPANGTLGSSQVKPSQVTSSHVKSSHVGSIAPGQRRRPAVANPNPGSSPPTNPDRVPNPTIGSTAPGQRLGPPIVINRGVQATSAPMAWLLVARKS